MRFALLPLKELLKSVKSFYSIYFCQQWRSQGYVYGGHNIYIDGTPRGGGV